MVEEDRSLSHYFLSTFAQLQRIIDERRQQHGGAGDRTWAQIQEQCLHVCWIGWETSESVYSRMTLFIPPVHHSALSSFSSSSTLPFSFLFFCLIIDARKTRQSHAITWTRKHALCKICKWNFDVGRPLARWFISFLALISVFIGLFFFSSLAFLCCFAVLAATLAIGIIISGYKLTIYNPTHRQRCPVLAKCKWNAPYVNPVVLISHRYKGP